MSQSESNLLLCFDVNCDSGFEVDGEAILEYCDLGNKPFDQRFIKFCDGGGLLPDEILQVLDQAHLLILDHSIHLSLLSHIPESEDFIRDGVVIVFLVRLLYKLLLQLSETFIDDFRRQSIRRSRNTRKVQRYPNVLCSQKRRDWNPRPSRKCFRQRKERLCLNIRRLQRRSRKRKRPSQRQRKRKSAQGVVPGVMRSLFRRNIRRNRGVPPIRTRRRPRPSSRSRLSSKKRETRRGKTLDAFREGARENREGARADSVGSTANREGASENREGAQADSELFGQIGYHMGKWIYLIDAMDDIEENVDSGAYNPLIYRFGFRGCVSGDETLTGETIAEFKERIHDRVEFNLFHYLAVMNEKIQQLDIKKNKGIIENVIYFGMNRKTEEILGYIQKTDNHKEDTNESI